MTSTPHILVVDDDKEIRGLLSRFLAKHDFRVTAAADGREMKKALADWNIDLIILDLMLPGETGLNLCRWLRTRSKVPVVMLTAMGDETDRIVGLEIGADDYLPKPFNPRELLARVRAVLRRSAAAIPDGQDTRSGALHFAGWSLDLVTRRLETPARVLVDLTTGEFDLLVVFAQRPNRVLSREQLVDLTHSRSAIPFDRSIDIQVSRLRRKIETDLKAPAMIKTVRGGGYLFTPTVERERRFPS